MAISRKRSGDPRCILPVLCAVVLASVPPCRAQEVSAATDKAAYTRSEKIVVTVTNNLKESIFSHAAGKTPEYAISNCERKKSQWSWDAYRLRCPWPDCEKGADAPGEIKTGKTTTFAWKPQVFAGKAYKGLESGLYRLTIIYQTRKGKGPDAWLWNTVKTNEFTLE